MPEQNNKKLQNNVTTLLLQYTNIQNILMELNVVHYFKDLLMKCNLNIIKMQTFWNTFAFPSFDHPL